MRKICQTHTWASSHYWPARAGVLQRCLQLGWDRVGIEDEELFRGKARQGCVNLEFLLCSYWAVPLNCAEANVQQSSDLAVDREWWNVAGNLPKNLVNAAEAVQVSCDADTIQLRSSWVRNPQLTVNSPLGCFLVRGSKALVGWLGKGEEALVE